MHYYQFNIGDYSSHTQHLEPLEDLAYRRMLDWCYLNESILPKDIDEIARLIRMRTHSECIATVLRDFFVADGDGYSQCRIVAEITAFKEKSAKAKKSAKARWSKTPSNSGDSSDANALRTHCEGNAKHKPLTINHKPLTKEIKTSSSGDDGDERIWAGFFIFWDEYPKKVGKKDAIKAWNKLKPTSDLINRVLTNIGARKMAGQEKQFWPNPATYLNGERWEDEIIYQEKSNGTRKQNSKRLESLNGESNHDWRDPNNTRCGNH